MDARRLLEELLDRLWTIYCDRVHHARRYVELVTAKGGRVVNDHIAFRTFHAKTGAQPPGIAAIERIFVPLGYEPAGHYAFPDQHLRANHYRHPDPLAPKIFISQLEVDELPDDVANLLRAAVADGVDRFEPEIRDGLRRLDALSESGAAALADRMVQYFTSLPWSPPVASLVARVNEVSQYGAWTLLHGNNVNHFTAYVNEQNVPDWPDIEATVAALRAAGVPMKAEIEGAPGSRLRQSATQAVDVPCTVRDDQGHPATLRWSYAYYELAERGNVLDENGNPVRFQGFLGPQAAQLFRMTERK